jgi:hypothetical protein
MSWGGESVAERSGCGEGDVGRLDHPWEAQRGAPIFTYPCVCARQSIMEFRGRTSVRPPTWPEIWDGRRRAWLRSESWDLLARPVQVTAGITRPRRTTRTGAASRPRWPTCAPSLGGRGWWPPRRRAAHASRSRRQPAGRRPRASRLTTPLLHRSSASSAQVMGLRLRLRASTAACCASSSGAPGRPRRRWICTDGEPPRRGLPSRLSFVAPKAPVAACC